MKVWKNGAGGRWSGFGSFAFLAVSLGVILWAASGCIRRGPAMAPAAQPQPGIVNTNSATTSPPAGPSQPPNPPPPPALPPNPPVATNPPPPAAQPPPPASSESAAAGQAAVPVLDLEKQLVEFQRSLSQSVKEQSDYLTTQADRHRELLEFYYKLTLGFLALCGAILTFFFAKSLHEAKAIINQNIESIKTEARTAFNQTVADSLQGFNDSLSTNKALAEAAVKKLQKDYTHDRRTIIWLSSVVARAYVVLSHAPIKDPGEKTAINLERKAVIGELKGIQEKWSATNRTVAIALGRLYRLAGQYEEAYNELEEVLRKLTPQDPDSAQDYADILYNQACYLSLQAETTPDGPGREALRQRAWETLKKSISLRPENREDVKTEDDLKSVFSGARRREDL